MPWWVKFLRACNISVNLGTIWDICWDSSETLEETHARPSKRNNWKSELKSRYIWSYVLIFLPWAWADSNPLTNRSANISERLLFNSSSVFSVSEEISTDLWSFSTDFSFLFDRIWQQQISWQSKNPRHTIKNNYVMKIKSISVYKNHVDQIQQTQISQANSVFYYFGLCFTVYISKHF